MKLGMAIPQVVMTRMNRSSQPMGAKGANSAQGCSKDQRHQECLEAKPSGDRKTFSDNAIDAPSRIFKRISQFAVNQVCQ